MMEKYLGHESSRFDYRPGAHRVGEAKRRFGLKLAHSWTLFVVLEPYARSVKRIPGFFSIL